MVGDNYKFIKHKFPVRKSGLEEKQNMKLFNYDFIQLPYDDFENDWLETNDSLDEFFPDKKKLITNIITARTKLLNLVQCNNFEWFGTLTFDIQKVDRFSYDDCKKSLQKLFYDYTHRKNKEFAYICIPEQHQDDAYHFHCMFKGIPMEDLRLFTLEEKLPYDIRFQLEKGEEVYTWLKYPFGYTSFSKIKNLDACSVYVTKYITKNLVSSVPFGQALYLRSRKLLKPVILAQGEILNDNGIDFTFDNEFCSICNFKDFSGVQLEHYWSKFIKNMEE